MLKRLKIMKRIILIRSTRPDTDSRLTKIASYLVDYGYEILILGWDRKKDAPNKESLLIRDKQVPIRLFDEERPHGQGLKGFTQVAHFQKWIKKELLKEKDNILAVHACDLDCGKPARQFSKRNKIKYVYDIFDLYSVSRRMPNVLKPIFNSMEKKVINDSFATIICTDERRKQIDFSKPKRLFVIYNSPEIPSEVMNINSFDGKQLKLCYVGILSRSRMLNEVVNVVINNKDLYLSIGGFGPLEEEIKEKINGCDNVRFLGQMKYRDVLELESKSDVLFATYDPSIKAHKMSAPNKFYEAVGLGKPIIVCNETGINSLVKKYDVGETCDYNEESFLEACHKLQNKERYLTCSKNCSSVYPLFSADRNKKTLKEIYDLLLEDINK